MFGKELFIRFTGRGVCERISICVCVCVFSFPFGSEDEKWDLILSVPDHCVSFYFIQFSRRFSIRTSSSTCHSTIKKSRIFKILSGKSQGNVREYLSVLSAVSIDIVLLMVVHMAVYCSLSNVFFN